MGSSGKRGQSERRGTRPLPADTATDHAERRDFYADSLGRTKGQLQDARTQLESLAEQVSQQEAQAEIQEMVDPTWERFRGLPARPPGDTRVPCLGSSYVDLRCAYSSLAVPVQASHRSSSSRSRAMIWISPMPFSAAKRYGQYRHGWPRDVESEGFDEQQ